jgi:ferric-dicitrate binding protein FerR (iron transport regulator)
MQIADLLSFFKERMAQAYAEQIWAVALIGSMNAFVIKYAPKLEERRTRLLAWGIGLGAALALLFIWSRQGIFHYYNALAKKLIAEQAPVSLPDPSWLQAVASQAVGWSGVLLYTLVVAGVTWASLRVLKKKKK